MFDYTNLPITDQLLMNIASQLPITDDHGSQRPITDLHCSRRPIIDLHYFQRSITELYYSQWPIADQWSQRWITEYHCFTTLNHWSSLFPVTNRPPFFQRPTTTVPTDQSMITMFNNYQSLIANVFSTNTLFCSYFKLYSFLYLQAIKVNDYMDYCVLHVHFPQILSNSAFCLHSWCKLKHFF